MDTCPVGANENIAGEGYLLSSHSHRGRRRSTLYVLRPDLAKRDEPEGSDGAAPDLFALSLVGLHRQTRREKNPYYRVGRRLDPKKTPEGISVLGDRCRRN